MFLDITAIILLLAAFGFTAAVLGSPTYGKVPTWAVWVGIPSLILGVLSLLTLAFGTLLT